MYVCVCIKFSRSKVGHKSGRSEQGRVRFGSLQGSFAPRSGRKQDGDSDDDDDDDDGNDDDSYDGDDDDDALPHTCFPANFRECRLWDHHNRLINSLLHGVEECHGHLHREVKKKAGTCPKGFAITYIYIYNLEIPSSEAFGTCTGAER